MDLAGDVAGEERVRHALNDAARQHLTVGPDGDAKIKWRTDEDVEHHRGAQADGEVAVVERDRVGLAPNRECRLWVVVEREAFVDRAVHRCVTRVVEPPLVGDHAGHFGPRPAQRRPTR
jgi:hypothetical protein